MGKLVGFWVAAWTAAGLGFWYADRHHFALCTALRWLFRTHTNAGRVRFGLALGSGTVVLYRHVVKPGTFKTV